jgi:hypothetical protein
VSLVKAIEPEIGSATVTEGASSVSLKVPEDAKGDYQVKFMADPSGTTVLLPLSVVAAAAEPSSAAPTESSSPAPTSSPASTDPAGNAGTDGNSASGGNAGNGGNPGNGNGDLAHTGTDAGPWVLGGVVTVLLGAALAVLGTRRRPSHR